MESKLFLKAMAVFPAKVSDAYDRKITESGIDYKAALMEGLARVPGKPHHILDLCTGTGFAACACSPDLKACLYKRASDIMVLIQKLIRSVIA